MVDCAEAESYAIRTVFPKARIYFCDFHVGRLWEKQLVKFSEEGRKQMRPLLNEVRKARSPELQQALWTRFKELYSRASSLINYIQKNWFDKEGRLEKWALFHREDRQVVTTNNWIEPWHARLKGYHLDGDRNLRVDRLVCLLQDRVDRGFRFAYLKTKRGFKPIPWRKGDEERKQKADKVSFDDAQRKISYNRDQCFDDGRFWISMQSLDPGTPNTYYTLVGTARSGQLLSCSCRDFTERNPLPCKHLFLAERVFHDLWLSFLRPSVSANAIENRTITPNDNTNDNTNHDNIHNNTDSGAFEQDSYKGQLAVLNPYVYTQVEYERARKEEKERYQRRERRKRDFDEAEEELWNNGRMIVELMNKISKTYSLEELQAVAASSKTLVHQLGDLFQ